MKFLENIRLSYYAYKNKYILFYSIIFLVPILFLAFFKDISKIDFYMFALSYIGFIMFSLYVGMYQYSKLSSCYLNITIDRHSYILSSLLSLIIHLIVQTVFFIINIVLMLNYFQINEIALSNFNYLSFSTIIIFVVSNLLMINIGYFSSLFTKRFNKFLYILLIIVLLSLSIKNISMTDFIYEIFNFIFIKKSLLCGLTSLFVSIIIYFICLQKFINITIIG